MNFKKSLIIFSITISMFSNAIALETSNMISKTSNINSPINGSNQMTIDMNKTAGIGAVGQIDWKSYNIPQNQTIKYGFSNSSQTIINRVLGGNTSYIYGKIISGCSTGVSCGNAAATGKILLINPAGVVFGSGSSIDLNSFTVSTRDINGIKNLSSVKNMSDYQKTLKNNYSQNIKFVNGTSKGTIWLDNAKITANKSINIQADNINYKNSMLKTTEAGGKVQLVSADGVTFVYNNKGNTTSTTAGALNAKRTIYMDNSKLGSKAAIQSSKVNLIENSKSSDSYLYMANSIIKGTKLATNDNGDILIVGSNNVMVYNDKVNAGGNIAVNSKNSLSIANASTLSSSKNINLDGKNISILNSNLKGDKVIASATDKAYLYSNGSISANTASLYGKNLAYMKDAKMTGNNLAQVASDGYAQVLDNSQIASSNKINVASGNQTYVNKSLLYSQGDIKVSSANRNYVYNSDVMAKGNTNLSGYETYLNNTYASGKNVNLSATNGVSVANNSSVYATQNVNLTTRGSYILNSNINANNSFNANLTNAIVVNNSKIKTGKNMTIATKNGIFAQNSKVNNINVKINGQKSVSYRKR